MQVDLPETYSVGYGIATSRPQAVPQSDALFEAAKLGHKSYTAVPNGLPSTLSQMLLSHIIKSTLGNETDTGGGAITPTPPLSAVREGVTLYPVESGTHGTAAWDNYTWNGGDDIGVGHFNVTLEDANVPPLHLAASILAGLFLGTIIIMTICGNLLVLLAVFVNSHLRSTTNYFIVNLAIADLLLGTCVLPFSASLEIFNVWAFGPIFCDIWAAVDVLCCTASIMSLCVISIDRYIGVTRPLQHSSILTQKRALYIIILVWVLATAISIAPLLGWKEPTSSDSTVCEVTKQIGYVLFSVAGSFYIPLIIILVVYFRVYREALNQSRFLATGIKKAKTDEHCEVTLRIHTGRPTTNNQPPKNPNYQSSSSSEHSEGSKKNNAKLTLAGKVAKFKREKKAAKTLGIVVGVFIICWFPFFFILPLGKSIFNYLCTRLLGVLYTVFGCLQVKSAKDQSHTPRCQPGTSHHLLVFSICQLSFILFEYHNHHSNEAFCQTRLQVLH